MKKQAKKTSADIANITGVPKSTIDKLFAGQTKDPQLSTVSAVVHCLGYTLDDLDDTYDHPADDEQEIEGMAKQLYEALLKAGKVKEEQPLTPQQIQGLDGVCAILDALFDE